MMQKIKFSGGLNTVFDKSIDLFSHSSVVINTSFEPVSSSAELTSRKNST
jgi:hypothetical protein